MTANIQSRSPAARPESHDPADHLHLVTGPDAGDFLAVAVAAMGGRLLSWRARDVAHTPTRGATACYHTKVRWPDGHVTSETLAACAGDVPAGAPTLECGPDRVGVWRFPHDPDLPGLAAAHDPTALAGLLDDLGLGGGPVRLQVRAYRPRRRAVVEAVGPHGRLFCKVVRPDRVEALHRRHRLVVAAGIPAPQSLGWTPDGLLVLQALPGPTLRDALRSRTTPVPHPDAITTLLDGLPVELVDGPARPSWLDRVRHYGAVVAAALPDQAARITQIAAAVAAEAATGPTVPVHGDLYESQLLVDGGRICGLLDLDAARPGDRIDDLACLLGHLAVLAHTDPDRAAAINRVGARYLAAFDRTVDPADLRYRVAAVVVSLATGPHRVQQPRWPAATRRLVDLADRWLDSARAARR
jgi:hypothetical protein